MTLCLQEASYLFDLPSPRKAKATIVWPLGIADVGGWR